MAALFNNTRYQVQAFIHLWSAFLHCIALVRLSHLILTQSKLDILRVSHGFYAVCIAVMHLLYQRQNPREAFLVILQLVAGNPDPRKVGDTQDVFF